VFAVAAVGVLCLVLLPMAPTSAAVAPLSVQVGAPLFEMPEAAGAPADGDRFYAPALDVHAGDTVTFAFAGFHTATLLPANTNADTFVQDETSGVDGAYSFIIPDPDDGGTADQPLLKANPAIVAPTIGGVPVTCGTDTNPCSAGSAVVNSGLPFAEPAAFSVTANAAVGQTVSVLCLIHTAMRLDINVVASTATTTTQAEIDTYLDTTSASDATKAGKKHQKLLNGQTGTQLSDGSTMWDAYAGFDGPGYGLLAMYPAVLDIKKGDSVRWQFDKLRFEDHTVTMPFADAKDVAKNTFVPYCDLDGAGSDPRVAPDLPPPAFCGAGELEFSIPTEMAYQQGNGTFKGSDYENSGAVGANFDAGVAPFDVKFAAVSPNKGFKYMCLIHGGFMHGFVKVARS
jgi:plastocyanin